MRRPFVIWERSMSFSLFSQSPWSDDAKIKKRRSIQLPVKKARFINSFKLYQQMLRSLWLKMRCLKNRIRSFKWSKEEQAHLKNKWWWMITTSIISRENLILRLNRKMRKWPSFRLKFKAYKSFWICISKITETTFVSSFQIWWGLVLCHKRSLESARSMRKIVFRSLKNLQTIH